MPHLLSHTGIRNQKHLLRGSTAPRSLSSVSAHAHYADLHPRTLQQAWEGCESLELPYNNAAHAAVRSLIHAGREAALAIMPSPVPHA